MLHRRMNISKVPLQAILAVDGIGASNMEHPVHSPNRFMHTMGNG